VKSAKSTEVKTSNNDKRLEYSEVKKVVEVTGILNSFLKTSPFVFLMLALATGFVLFVGNDSLSDLGLLEIKEANKTYIGAVFVLSVSAVAAQLLTVITKLIKNWFDKLAKDRAQRTLINHRNRILHSLTPDEKAYLLPFIKNNETTCYYSVQDGIAGGLHAKQVLFLSSSVGNMITGFPYNLQPWAKEYLTKNPRLLDGASLNPKGPPVF
jgi:hypothetical protein